MPTPISARWILLLALALTVALYANGLDGPFLFDDNIHITQNKWVKIDSLTWPDLAQAWNSSFSNFPSNRPLSQLTFGINHALTGLDPWPFKFTNLVIHLATGLLVFLFTRLVYRALADNEQGADKGMLLALATTALWLLHPMHVSTVLYTVQRMAQLSSLALLAALSSYMWGRLQIADGKGGIRWILAAGPIAAVGFLAKENTVLLPLLLLAMEFTVLRGVTIAPRRGAIRLIWAFFIALPLVAGLVYLLTHPGLLSYDIRPFTLEERVLTQPRVLLSYLKWLFVPDITAFGLFHDDIEISTGITSPPSTLIAIITWTGLTLAAVTLRRKTPMFAFSVLFFLASHALESSVFPLEMVFEHRNYLASIGPLMFLAYLATIASERFNVRSLAITVGALLLLSYAFVAHVRVDNWSSYKTFILSSAQNHPKSARSNFMAAQMLIGAVGSSENAAPELADAARSFLHNGLEADARCINCMLGLVVLDLHQEMQPPSTLIARISDALRAGYVGPTKVSISQFSYLVKWQQSDGIKLPAEDLEAIFDAALSNPGWVHTGRAGIEAAYREYYEFAVQDLPSALKHAQAAISFWPEQWNYRMQLVRVLHKLGRPSEALAALDVAATLAGNDIQRLETAEARRSIERQ
jgi:hypothetical protein